ncbi:hypothetical protein PENSPDRAFT_756018 [Peniophora sp. CONT]|nr:hypothetical protein PENSPDRAFT_756018 [Peniophora sp. CONT]
MPAMNSSQKRALSTGDGLSSGGTTTMLLGFLIVFISLFVVLVIGGIAFHQIYRRRRGARLEVDSARIFRDSKGELKVPRLADVWVEEKDADVVKGRLDDNFQPLSVAKLHDSNADAHEAISSPPNKPRFLPTTFRKPTFSSPSQLRSERSVANEKAQVSFIITMPSPSHSQETSRRPSIASEGSSSFDAKSWQNREYAIGTCTAVLPRSGTP